MSRCRSFLPDLMTVRAVMVRAALEKKKCSWVPGTVLVPVSDNFGCYFLQFWLLFSAFDET